MSTAELAEKDLVISQLRSALKAKELIIEQEEEECKERVKEAVSSLEKQVQELQMQVSEQQGQVGSCVWEATQCLLVFSLDSGCMKRRAQPFLLVF